MNVNLKISILISFFTVTQLASQLEINVTTDLLYYYVIITIVFVGGVVLPAAYSNNVSVESWLASI